MYHLRVHFDAILDTPDHPNERVITIDNGLPADDPDYQALTQCVLLLPDGKLDIQVLAASSGSTFGPPERTPASEPAVHAQWVHGDKGVWLRFENRDIGHLAHEEHQLLLQTFVTAVAGYLGWTLDWERDAAEPGA